MENTKKTALITGSEGFLGSYLVDELLAHGYSILGIDDFSKYGRIVRAHQSHNNFELHEFDITKDTKKFADIVDNNEINYVINCASKVGGISYFTLNSAMLILQNSLIDSHTISQALRIQEKGDLERLVITSSSMVFEGIVDRFPTKESDLIGCAIPNTTYGFSKLHQEFMAKGCREQYNTPTTVIRPYNCVGIGEQRALHDVAIKLTGGNKKLMLSHVLPDVIVKTLKSEGQPIDLFSPGTQRRAYTHGKSIAEGIRLAMESPNGLNNDFNISISKTHTVLELAEIVWKEVYGDSIPFRYNLVPGYPGDVMMRQPDVTKSKELLGFEAKITLEETVKEVVEHFRNHEEIINYAFES